MLVSPTANITLLQIDDHRNDPVASSKAFEQGLGTASMTTAAASCVYHALGICMQHAQAPAGQPLFGIGEFLTAIAVFAVAYTMADERYKFRLAVSAIPIHTIFFAATILTGIGVIALPFWFELGLPIPSLLNNQKIFEAFFAAVVIGLIALWTYVAFISRPKFSRRNAFRFAQRVFQTIADGEESELSAVAYELGRSAKPIIDGARKRMLVYDARRGGIKREKTNTAEIAHDLVLLMGDRRLCHLVARRMPWVAAVFFREMEDYRGGIPIEQFAKNVVAELFRETNSAIHHEDDGYRSGLIGYLKPISSSLFGNSALIDSLSGGGGSPIDPLWLDTRSWSIQSWHAYSKAVLIYLKDKLRRHRSLEMIGTAIHQIGRGYEHACSDLYRVNSMAEEDYGSSIEYLRVGEVVDFVSQALQLVDDAGIQGSRLVELDGTYVRHKDLIDVLALIAKELIVAAGTVSTADFRSWNVQHNTIWSGLMRDYEVTYAKRLFQSRLSRLLWAEIRKMETMPNYVGARILGVCINVMGFRLDHAVHRPRETRALKRAVSGWCQRNFMTLWTQYPDVALACVIGNITFDHEKRQLTKTYASNLGRLGQQEHLQLR
ncbi:hypothetical protein EHI44_10995 [Rhizobium leguminosarum]|uniref:hypothetical protein n=1 Tax=Rhizobium leguminosarum TaxID=384 RepID=UPI000FED88E4|nr:hypothetical protein [Rhizobium leguminosarum]RWY88575.1 hypothetical protein EHI44_10995 [Rhizobium leguminosarum]